MSRWLRKSLLFGLQLFVFINLEGCSAITRENRFTPRLEDFKSSDYTAMSRGASAIYVGTPAPTALIAGERPELVLTSSDYEVTLRASAKGERVLTLGPCIIIPLPIIPILFLNQTSNENLKLHGTISSLKGQDFKLSKVGATVGANKFEQLDLIDNKTTYENTKKNSSDLGGNDKPLSIKQQKITFNAIVPLSIQSVENIDVDIQLTEGQKDIVIPSIHLHSSSGTVWAICVM